jgi:hypothetical protein
MKTTKVSSGNYTIETNGKKFDLDRMDDGTWSLFEVVWSPALQDEKREYWQSYQTKRAALYILEKYIA